MKVPKTIHALLIAAVISIFAGCSEQITSSGEVSTKTTKIRKLTVDEGFPIEQKVYRVRLRLDPQKTYKFGSSQAGFTNFTSIDISISGNPVEKFASDCQDIFVHGSSSGVDFPLTCHSKGFNAKEISIENLSTESIDILVIFQGTKPTAIVD